MRFAKAALLVICATFLALHTAPAQNKKMTPEQEAAAKKMMELCAPGKEHKMLDNMVGNWNAASKSRWEGPDAPWTEESGTCMNKWALDGRFVEMH